MRIPAPRNSIVMPQIRLPGAMSRPNSCTPKSNLSSPKFVWREPCLDPRPAGIYDAIEDEVEKAVIEARRRELLEIVDLAGPLAISLSGVRGR